MKTTFELYRQPSKLWAELPYKEALKVKITFARAAMDYYRSRLDEDAYIASEKAMNFNRELLEEITDDR
jgi:hypothetical protein